MQDLLQSLGLSCSDTLTFISTEDDKAAIHAALCNETLGHTWLDHLDNEILVTTMLVLEDNLPISDACYYDTGANWHIFNNKTVFDTYVSIEPVAIKGFRKDITIAAVGCGSVCVEGHYSNCKCNITLTNVLYIPAAHCNLVSGIQLDKVGITVVTGIGCNT